MTLFCCCLLLTVTHDYGTGTGLSVMVCARISLSSNCYELSTLSEIHVREHVCGSCKRMSAKGIMYLIQTQLFYHCWPDRSQSGCYMYCLFCTVSNDPLLKLFVE